MSDDFEGFGPMMGKSGPQNRAHDPSRVVDINKFRRRQDLLQLTAQNPERLQNAVYDYEEDKILNDNDIEYNPKSPYPMPVENRFN
jgi:hypothetical protein